MYDYPIIRQIDYLNYRLIDRLLDQLSVKSHESSNETQTHCRLDNYLTDRPTVQHKDRIFECIIVHRSLLLPDRMSDRLTPRLSVCRLV